MSPNSTGARPAGRPMAPWKFFALTAVFTAIGIWMVLDPSPSRRMASAGAVRVIGWLVIALFGVGGLFMLVQWLRAGRPSDVGASHRMLAERRRG